MTLLGDVRKEYLMPKICIEKEYLWLRDHEGCWRGGSRWGNGRVGEAASRLFLAAVHARPLERGIRELPLLRGHLPRGPPGEARAPRASWWLRPWHLQEHTHAVRLIFQLPPTFRRVLKDDSCSTTHMMRPRPGWPRAIQVKITNTNYRRA